MEKVKQQLNKDVARVGTKNIDHFNLEAIEAVTMSVVAVLALTVGTIYGQILSMS